MKTCEMQQGFPGEESHRKKPLFIGICSLIEKLIFPMVLATVVFSGTIFNVGHPVLKKMVWFMLTLKDEGNVLTV